MPLATCCRYVQAHTHGTKDTSQRAKDGAREYLDGMAPNTFRIAANTRFPPTPLGVPVQTLVRRCLLLDNMVPARELQKENERKEFEVGCLQICHAPLVRLTPWS